MDFLHQLVAGAGPEAGPPRPGPSSKAGHGPATDFSIQALLGRDSGPDQVVVEAVRRVGPRKRKASNDLSRPAPILGPAPPAKGETVGAGRDQGCQLDEDYDAF
jgi:hypothetical protein